MRIAAASLTCQTCTLLISAVAASSIRLCSGTEPVPVIHAAVYCTPTLRFSLQQ